MGYNLDHVGQNQQAYQPLHDAYAARPGEPQFADELSVNDAILAQALAQNKDASNASRLAQEAISISDSIVSNHPNVVTFWKTRVRVFYALSQIDNTYLSQALLALEKARALAPTDAKVSYNLGLLYGQTGQYTKSIQTLEKTIALRPIYTDA